MKKLAILLASFLFVLLLVSCAHQQSLESVDTTDMMQLEKIKVDTTAAANNKTEISQLRAKALQDSAMSIGAQGGLAWASKKINTKLDIDKKYLDSIYNFNVMMLNHGVLPPVLEQGDNSLNIDDPNTIRVADRTYKIVAQARFATTPPNWREYLWLNFDKPTLPDRTLLPRTNEEQQVWKKGIRDGWIKGIEQAYSIFRQNLARLKRDYNGMVLYRKLLQEKMISPPFVARTELGVTGDGEDMRVNDQVLRIVELPKLQTNTNHWNAIVVKRHE